MRVLADLVAPSAVSATWSALADAAVRGSLILLFAAAATALLRQSSAALRHLVWSAAVVAVLALPVLSLVLPAVRVPVPARLGAIAARVTPDVYAASAQAPLPVDEASVYLAPDHVDVAPAEAMQPATALSAAADAQQVYTQAAAAPAPISAELPVSAYFPSASASPWLTRLSLVWLAGALLLLARMALGSARVALVARSAERETDAMWLSMAQRFAATLGIRRPVTLLRGREDTIPMTWGVVYPVVLLPAGCDEWPTERRSAVLLHELAHVTRLDAATQLAANLACALQWFNPLVWLAARQMRVERERACDDRVLAAGVRASSYATDLLDLVRSLASAQSLAWTTLAMARRSQLEGRLLAILDPRSSRATVGRAGGWATVVGALLLVLPLAALRPALVEAALPMVTAPFEATLPLAPAMPLAAPTALAAPMPFATPAPLAAAAPLAELVGPAELAPAPARAPLPLAIARTAGASAEPCEFKGGSFNNMTSSRDGKKSWRASWSGEDCSVDLRSEGEVTFNRDFTDVERITPGGYLTIVVRDGDEVRRLEVRPDGDDLDRKWTVDGRAQPWNAEGREWLAAFLVVLDRHTGFAAQARFPRIYGEGGARAVLDEISKIQGDYVKGIYFRRLLDTARLDDAMLTRTLRLVGREMTSDYERARVLLTVAANYGLESAAQQTAYAEAVGGLSSDYERSRSILALLEKRELSADVAKLVLDLAARNTSDYEKSRVLVALVGKRLIDAPLHEPYLAAVRSLSSDYEKSRSLLALLGGTTTLSKGNVLLAIRASSSIASDYEKARVLLAVADKYPLEGDVRDAYLDAADQIKSDSEHRRVMSAAVRRERTGQ